MGDTRNESLPVTASTRPVESAASSTSASDRTRDQTTPKPSGVKDADLAGEVERLRAENERLKQNVARIQLTVASLQEQFEALQSSSQAAINRQVVADEYLDGYTDRHIARIGRYSALIAENLGLGDTEVRKIEYASPLHDIGKSQVPRDILIKPGRLSDIEFIEVKLHTIFGGRLLSDPDSPILNKAREIALSHHENWNGTGYPIKLRGKQIPLAGRIVRVIDMFDTLTSRRAHKMAYPIDVAFDMINQERGRSFDPDIVDCMRDALDAFIKAKADIDDLNGLPDSVFAFSDRDRALPSSIHWHG